jgi:ketosteroid isomerase-like protein
VRGKDAPEAQSRLIAFDTAVMGVLPSASARGDTGRSMSQENVEIVLESLRQFEAHDFEGFARSWHSDGWVTAPDGWPEPGPFEGRDALMAQFRRLPADLGEQRVRDVEVVAQRDGWVVVGFIWEVQGAGSGAAVASKLAGAWRLEGGKMMEAHFRWTPAEALEAAGLRE